MPETKPTNPKDMVSLKKLPMFSVVSPASLAYEAWAMRNGAEKYGPYNYRENGVRAGVYIDAAIRHLGAWWDGEDLAEDSKVHHLAHAKACLGIIIDGIEHGNLVDDRPPKSNFPGILTKLQKDNKND